jgi:hypothetical protein
LNKTTANEPLRFNDTDGADCILIPITADNMAERTVEWVKMLYSGFRRATERGATQPWYLNEGNVRFSNKGATGELSSVARVALAAREGEVIRRIDNRILDQVIDGKTYNRIINYRDDNLRITKGPAKRVDYKDVKKS